MTMVPMTESAFFMDPFIAAPDVKTIVELAKQSKLVLDIDTSHIFDSVDVENLSLEDVKSYLLMEIGKMKAKLTLPFEAKKEDIHTMVMKKGQFIIFTERTMHRSLPNNSKQARVGINSRVTTTDVAIYPQRLKGDFIDGSNLDISKHSCLLLHGKVLNQSNIYRTFEENDLVSMEVEPKV